MNFRILAVYIILLFLVGCTTSGVNTITIDSTPESAKLYINGKYAGVTPKAIPNRWSEPGAKGETKIIRLIKPGYKPFERVIKPRELHDRWLAGDYIQGSQFGHGATYPYSINLEQKDYANIIKQPARDTIKHVPSTNLKQYQSLSTNNSWAVIIGISKYKYSGNKGLRNLIFADDDAKSFAGTLQNLGWNESHIKLLINSEATKRNVEIALESWLTKAGQNDQVILFWAGHGYPDPENPEKVYFANYDTDISIPSTGYRMDRVRDALEEIKSKNVILFADTCHAGKLVTRGRRGISIVSQINKMNREQKVPKGWIFMVGADTDRQAIEHTSWTNGAFTHSLIKGLCGEADGFQSAGIKDGVVTMGELKDFMNISMPDETQKVLGVAKRPVITTSTGDPDIWNLTLQVAQ